MVAHTTTRRPMAAADVTQFTALALMLATNAGAAARVLAAMAALARGYEAAWDGLSAA